MGGSSLCVVPRDRVAIFAGAVSELPAEDVTVASGDSCVGDPSRDDRASPGVSTPPIQSKTRVRGDDSSDSGFLAKSPKRTKTLRLAGVSPGFPRWVLPTGCLDIYGQPGGNIFAYRPLQLQASLEEPAPLGAGTQQHAQHAQLASLALNTSSPSYRIELYAMPLHLAGESLRSCVETVLHKAWDTDRMSKLTISNLLGLRCNRISLRSGRQTSRCETMGATNKEGRWLIWEEAVPVKVAAAPAEHHCSPRASLAAAPAPPPPPAPAHLATATLVPTVVPQSFAAAAEAPLQGAAPLELLQRSAGLPPSAGVAAAGLATTTNVQAFVAPPSPATTTTIVTFDSPRKKPFSAPSPARFGHRGFVVGALLLRKSPPTKRLKAPGGLVIDYVAADHQYGGRGYPLLCGADSICRSEGYQTLHSAADLSREGRTLLASEDGLLPAVRVPSAHEAHVRWGFHEMIPSEWKATGLELYDKKSHVTYMKKQVLPP